MSVKKVSTKGEFDLALQTDKLVLVDFYATWCGPCKIIGPKFAEMATEFQATVVALQVDVDEAEEISESAGVTAMPTFHAYRGGKKVGEVVGANEAKLRALFQK